MTSPFIEKLARAAFKADYAWRKANNAAFPKQDELSLPDDDAGLDTAFRLFVGLDERWTECVRAILTAMREPSEEMLDAAIAADSASSCETVWQAMLTQALKK